MCLEVISGTFKDNIFECNHLFFSFLCKAAYLFVEISNSFLIYLSLCQELKPIEIAHTTKDLDTLKRPLRPDTVENISPTLHVINPIKGF